MSDNAKKKKMDIRLPEDMFNKIALVAWGTGRKRSEMVREMIVHFSATAKVIVNGQQMSWTEAVEFFAQKLLEEDLGLEDISRSSSVRTEDSLLPDPLRTELENFADTYAASAILAFKKHMEERNND